MRSLHDNPFQQQEIKKGLEKLREGQYKEVLQEHLYRRASQIVPDLFPNEQIVVETHTIKKGKFLWKKDIDQKIHVIGNKRYVMQAFLPQLRYKKVDRSSGYQEYAQQCSKMSLEHCSLILITTQADKKFLSFFNNAYAAPEDATPEGNDRLVYWMDLQGQSNLIDKAVKPSSEEERKNRALSVLWTIRVKQIMILQEIMLRHPQPVKQSELADAFGVGRNTMNEIINQLSSFGFVRRTKGKPQITDMDLTKCVLDLIAEGIGQQLQKQAAPTALPAPVSKNLLQDPKIQEMLKEIQKEGNSGFTDEGFWTKIRDYAIQAGRNLVEKALTLYYVAEDEDTPLPVKASIFITLAYFISPIDAIPDFLIGGFADDLAAIMTTFGLISAYVKEHHKEKAQKKLSDYFDIKKLN